MNVLVTGCNGYIGAHTVRKLAEYGHRIWGIDNQQGNDVSKYVERITKHSILCNTSDRVMVALSERFDAIVHLAAYIKVGESMQYPGKYFHNNIYGTRCMLNVAAITDNPKFIFASTGAAFGSNSPYAISKIAAEYIIKERSNNYTIFRFFNVAGGDYKSSNEQGLLSSLERATDTFIINGGDYDTKDGTPVRDYIHVEDIALALCKAVEEPAAMTDYECLGSGHNYSVLEVAETYKRENAKDFNIIIGERREGDLAISAVPSVSRFVEQNYTLEDICSAKN